MGIGGCIKGNIKSKSQFQKDLDKKYGKNTYRLIGKYLGHKCLHKFKHSCGINFQATATGLLRGLAKCSCLHRSPKEKGDATRLTHSLVVKRLDEKYGKDEYRILELYTRNSKPIRIKHSCGKKFTTTAESLFNGWNRCPDCTKTCKKHTKETAQKRIDDFYGIGNYALIGSFKGTKGKNHIRHKCGHKYLSTMDGLFRGTSQCPKCFINSRGSAIKIVRLKGVKFRVQGYEPITLRRLIKKYKPHDLITGCSGKVPRINYWFNDKYCRYIPDFYIQSKHKIIEVKSFATLGLVPDTYAFFGEDIFERNQAKAQTCLRKGYKFQLDLYDHGGQKVQLPKNWYTMTKAQVASILGERHD